LHLAQQYIGGSNFVKPNLFSISNNNVQRHYCNWHLEILSQLAPPPQLLLLLLLLAELLLLLLLVKHIAAAGASTAT
jgi:hypothetical protein